MGGVNFPKSWVVQTSHAWCKQVMHGETNKLVEVVGGVWKSWVVCGSRRWCVEVVAVGSVWKS